MAGQRFQHFTALRDIVVGGKGVKAGETFEAPADELREGLVRALVKGYIEHAPEPAVEPASEGQSSRSKSKS